MITIYTIAWQEQFMIQYFITHYHVRFPGCKIIVYDNESRDDTRKIAEARGCEVRTFTTGNTLSDRTYLEIKNNVWKEAKTDWVLIADVDEHLNIWDADLKYEQSLGTSIIRAEGWNMISLQDELQSPFDLTHGVRAESYDKLYCFNKKSISEINYRYGCHKAAPVGDLFYSDKLYKCRHYKYLNREYMIARHALFAKRMSEHNKKHGLGIHYMYSKEEITKEFNEARKNAILV
jgi:hypothetical protein